MKPAISLLLPRSIVILLSILTCFVTNAQSGTWQQTAFPNNNYVYFIESFSDSLFAGSQDGLFLSVDGGEQWKNLTESNQIVAVNAIIKWGQQYYISSWPGGVFRSPDLVSWEKVNNGLPLFTTSLEVFEGNLYAGTSESVLIFDSLSLKWLPDNLKVKNIHNQYILAVKEIQGTLYASGCDYLYKKDQETWVTVDTNFQYCGNKIEFFGLVPVLNTTGSAVQQFDNSGAYISATLIADNSDSLSFSPGDIYVAENELFILSGRSIYMYTSGEVETVCDDYLTSLAITSLNIFAGTRNKGIWTKSPGAPPYFKKIKDTPSEISLTLNPVPTVGDFLAFFTVDDTQSALLSIFDVTGKVIYSQKIATSGCSDLHLNAPGLYFVILENGGKKSVQKIIVQK